MVPSSLLRRVLLFVYFLALVVPLQGGGTEILPPGFVSYRVEPVVGDSDETGEVLEPGEAFNLYLTLKNPNSRFTLTGVEATLTTTQPGVKITYETIGFNDLDTADPRESFDAAFLTISSELPCGTAFDVDVKVTTNESTREFSFPLKLGRSESLSDPYTTSPSIFTPPTECTDPKPSAFIQTLDKPLEISPVGETLIWWYQNYTLDAPFPSDLRFEVSTNGETWDVVQTYPMLDGNLLRLVDLTPYAGRGIMVRWQSIGADCSSPAYSRWWVSDVKVGLYNTRCDSTQSACLGILNINAPETSDGDTVVERDEIVTMNLQLYNPLPIGLTNLQGSISVDPTSATLIGDYSTPPLLKPYLGSDQPDGVTFRFIVSSSAVCRTEIPFILHVRSDQVECDLRIPVMVGGDPVIMSDNFENNVFFSLDYPWRVFDDAACVPGENSYTSATRSIGMSQDNSARKAGFPGACDYNTGSQVVANATSSGSWDIPKSANGVELSWNQVLITEDATNFDLAELQISTDFGETWDSVWSVPRNSTWEPRVFDLTAYEGQTIRFRFHFDSVDAESNNFPGWFIDDVKIALREPSCLPGEADPTRPTFCNPKSPLVEIPDFGEGTTPFGDMMTIRHKGMISELAVSVRIDHPRVSDLQLILSHVDTGTSVVLMNRPSYGSIRGEKIMKPVYPYCEGEDMVVLFDSLSDGYDIQLWACDIFNIPALNGTFMPMESLQAFNDEPIAGTWQLIIRDLARDVEVGPGYLRDWCLKPVLYDGEGFATIKATPSFGGPFNVGEEFDVYVTVPTNDSGIVPYAASITLNYPSNTVQLLSAQNGDLGAAVIEAVTGTPAASSQRVWTTGNNTNTKPFPNIYRLRFGVISAAVNPFSITLGEEPQNLEAEDGVAIPVSLEDSLLRDLRVNVRPTSTPLPTTTPMPSCVPGAPYTATPTAPVSPTVTATATPAVLTPAVLSVGADSTQITAQHTDLRDPSGRRQFIGFWSRSLNIPGSPWKYYGYVEYAAGTSTSIPWAPQPDSLYDVAARYFVDGQGWAGPSIYGRYNSFGYEAYPVIDSLNLDAKSSQVWIDFSTSGTLPTSIGFWSRPIDNSSTIPPHSADPLTGWTYHGLTPYPLGTTGIAIPFAYSSGVYEISCQVFVQGTGFIGAHVINYAPYGETGFPKLYGIHFNHSTGVVNVKFSPVGTEKCNVGLWFREISPVTCEPTCEWAFLGYQEYNPMKRDVYFDFYPQDPSGIFQFSARLNVFEYASGYYTGWFTPYFITKEKCTPESTVK